jgi:23S rRNA (uracil1939-C5)-methyltransferase
LWWLESLSWFDPMKKHTLNPEEPINTMSTNRETVKIKKLVYGGYGLGTVMDKAVFVPFGLPGDELEVEITKDCKTHCFGEIKKVVSHSGSYIEPDCPYFYTCGGCFYRHLDYGEELRWKGLILKELLGSLKTEDLPVAIHGSSRTKFYRNRVDFQVSEGRIGFYQRGSHSLVHVDFCPLAEKPINRLLKNLIDSGLLKNVPSLSQISLLSAGKDVFALLAFPKKWRSGNAVKMAKVFSELKGCAGVDVEGEPPFEYGKGAWTARTRTLNLFGSQSWEVSLPSFCQPNCSMNRKMISLCLEEIGEGQTILDLYAGSGNFSLPVALLGKKTTAVESNRFSISDLRRAKEKADLRNLDIVPSTVNAFLAAQGDKTWDAIIVDPPRVGMKKEVSILAAMDIRKLIYVSCNPATFARDASILVQNGFAMKRSHILDMFPRTYHFETLNVFER